jgi:hypothetical protein
MRRYEDLLSNDPAWPDLQEQIQAAGERAVALPRPIESARRAGLERLQVSTRSTLGAFAHETGGVLIDHGWLRLLGGGCDAMRRAIGGYNEALGVALGRYLIVADDAVGGVFAINSGELGPAAGNVFYFAPDALAWEDTELGHSSFVSWALSGDLDLFYENQRWPGWEREVGALTADEAINMWPALWLEKNLPVARRDRRAVPSEELWALLQGFAAAK